MTNKLNFLLLMTFLVFAFTSCKDATAPMIMLEGQGTMEHVLNADFIEPGFVAMDDKDGDVTDKVTVSTLDVNAAGAQIITYTVTDAEGNVATVERNVTVYNEVTNFEAFWNAEYVQPYPGLVKLNYTESITASATENMKIVFSNFANSGTAVTGTVILEGVINAPVVSFADDIAVNDAPIRNNMTKITVDYTLSSVRGVIVFDKQ